MEQAPVRLPPQNIEAEMATLGSILLENRLIASASEFLLPEHFYRTAHAEIFRAMLELAARNEPVDLVTLSERLKSEGKLEKVGGAAYLTSLVEYVPTSANFEYYSRIVYEKALLRSLIAVASNIQKRCYEEEGDLEEILDQTEREIFGVLQKRFLKEFVPIKEIVSNTFDLIEKLYDRKEQVTGIPTGFKDLDQLTSGLQRSDLIIIAARPSMGKTSFVLNIAAHVAINEKIPVAFFSLEMSRNQLVMRMLCSEAEVDSQRVRTGYLKQTDWPKLTIASGRLSEAPIYIDDTPGITFTELRSKARKLHAEKGLGLIILDYLQLMQTKGTVESRQQEISLISRSLKALARELEVPVLALSQLSRAVEQRPDKRPVLADLRESGAIEQDADVVMFIYRDEYYNENSPHAGIAEIRIQKHRNGPTGSVLLQFQKELTKFRNLTMRPELGAYDATL